MGVPSADGGNTAQAPRTGLTRRGAVIADGSIAEHRDRSHDT